MTNAKINQAVEAINRVEKQMIAAMSKAEYKAYMNIPVDTRKAMLYKAYKVANA